MISKKGILIIVVVAAVAIAAGLLLSGGLGGQKQAGSKAAQVKVVNVIKRDTPLTLEYAGQIKGKDTVKVTAKVSGTITEKYVKGGDYVTAGQPLYKVDNRTYYAALLNAQSNLAQAQANLNNAKIDLQRNQQLLASSAVSEQTVTTQQAQVNSLEANVAALTALVQQAQNNLDDTTVYAPISGKLAVDDVAVGTFAAAGSTPLVTIGSSNAMFVQFSISETEYLKYVANNVSPGQALPSKAVRITLSNGQDYPVEGRVAQVDRSIENNTGAIVIKAEFANPNGVLVDGMFARARLVGDTVKDAILVPQRAVQQLLGKSFVMMADENGKSVARNIEVGEKIGSYYIVRKGLDGSEKVIVEGLTGLTEGVDLTVSEVKPEDLGISFTDATK